MAAGEEGLAGRGAVLQLPDQPGTLIDRRKVSGGTEAILTCTRAPRRSAHRRCRHESFLASSHRHSLHPPNHYSGITKRADVNARSFGRKAAKQQRRRSEQKRGAKGFLINPQTVSGEWRWLLARKGSRAAARCVSCLISPERLSTAKGFQAPPRQFRPAPGLQGDPPIDGVVTSPSPPAATATPRTPPHSRQSGSAQAQHPESGPRPRATLAVLAALLLGDPTGFPPQVSLSARRQGGA